MPPGTVERNLRQAVAIVRIAVAVLLGVHGTTRILTGGVAPFGDFLAGHHIPLGHALAWGISIFELIGPVLLIANRLVSLVAPLHIVILATGIALVHAKNGWFVVGGGTGGVEYSVLLVAGLAAVFWAARLK
jgi:putative oxidoreductase